MLIPKKTALALNAALSLTGTVLLFAAACAGSLRVGWIDALWKAMVTVPTPQQAMPLVLVIAGVTAAQIVCFVALIMTLVQSVSCLRGGEGNPFHGLVTAFVGWLAYVVTAASCGFGLNWLGMAATAVGAFCILVLLIFLPQRVGPHEIVRYVQIALVCALAACLSGEALRAGRVVGYTVPWYFKMMVLNNGNVQPPAVVGAAALAALPIFLAQVILAATTLAGLLKGTFLAQQRVLGRSVALAALSLFQLACLLVGVPSLQGLLVGPAFIVVLVLSINVLVLEVICLRMRPAPREK